MTRSELVQTFANLREKWPQAWPGLNVVLDSALRRLGQDPEKASGPRSEAMRACAFEVARRIEAKAPALAKRRRLAGPRTVVPALFRKVFDVCTHLIPI